MLARRLMASTALQSVPADPGPQPVFGGRLSFLSGGLYESYRRPDGSMDLRTSNPSALTLDTRQVLSYSSGGTVGFVTIDATSRKHRLRKSDVDGNIIYDSGDVDLSQLLDAAYSTYASHCLEDRIAIVKKTSGGSDWIVESIGWSGPTERLGSVPMPALIADKLPGKRIAIGTIDAQTLILISNNRGVVESYDGKYVGGGHEIPYDYFSVSNVTPVEPVLGAMFDTSTGTPREFMFEPFPECDVTIPDGAEEIPVHVRSHTCTVKSVAFGIDGGACFVASCTVTEMRWDGTVLNDNPDNQLYINASLARNTTEFIAKVDAAGDVSLVRLLSKNSWWFELQEFWLGQDFSDGSHRIVFTAISSPRFSTPRVISQAADNFNFASKPPVTQSHGDIIRNGPRSWAVLDGMTYLDHGKSFMLFRDGAWNSGVFWKIGASSPEKIEVDIPPGGNTNDQIGAFEAEQVWILRQLNTSGTTKKIYERSARTAWAFEEISNSGVWRRPDGFYTV